MALIEIKHRSGSTLHTIEADSIKAAVEALVEKGANLGDANLRGAYLREEVGNVESFKNTCPPICQR